jgi:hypothetical protein
MVVEEKIHSSGDSENPSVEHMTGKEVVVDESGKEVASTERTQDSQEVGSIERQGFDAEATKKLLWKIDWTLVPFLALLYLLSFLDRTNIGNARLFGLEKSLGMDPNSLQYNTALSVFFPWYVAVS